jgi:hypothetical protein
MDTMMKWGSLVERRKTELRSEGFENRDRNMQTKQPDCLRTRFGSSKVSRKWENTDRELNGVVV